jgi:hypothetical protein
MGRFTENMSFFWQQVCQLLYFMRLSMKNVVGDGHEILFWHDN